MSTYKLPNGMTTAQVRELALQLHPHTTGIRDVPSSEYWLAVGKAAGVLTLLADMIDDAAQRRAP